MSKCLVLSLLVVLLSSPAEAFVTPGGPLRVHARTLPQTAIPFDHPHRGVGSSTQLALGISGDAIDNLVDKKTLVTYFLETLISYGVPAGVAVVVIFFAAGMMRSRRSKLGNRFGGDSRSAVSELYQDLYGGQSGSADTMSPFGDFGFLPKRNSKVATMNPGTPSKQYLTITNLNEKYDSYKYSITTARQSKAAAAATLRSQNFDRALGMSSTLGHDLLPHEKKALLEAEEEFLKEGAVKMDEMLECQTKLTDLIIAEEMKEMGVEVGELDIKPTNETEKAEKAGAKKSKKDEKVKESLQNDLENAQADLIDLEVNFIRDLVSALGPDRANALRVALLGDISTRGVGQLLSKLQDRPLATVLGRDSKPSLFVLDFPGDVQASQVDELREEVTAILRAAKPGDEVVLILQSGGGTVTGYGLAAGQLKRFTDNGTKLTICVEQVAASGGYMMACTADKIVASPFAVLGSIGVITDIPNVYERLKKEGIEFQTVTAGKFKRTLTPTKRATKEDFDKTKADVEEILTLFKGFVAANRPSLDIDKVATGETWFGSQALEMGLCDEIKAADDVLTEYVDKGFDVYSVSYGVPDELGDLKKLLPVGESRDGPKGWIRQGVRWLVNTVSEEVRAELRGSDSATADKKYMLLEDSADRYRMM